MYSSLIFEKKQYTKNTIASTATAVIIAIKYVSIEYLYSEFENEHMISLEKRTKHITEKKKKKKSGQSMRYDKIATDNKVCKACIGLF